MRVALSHSLTLHLLLSLELQLLYTLLLLELQRRASRRRRLVIAVVGRRLLAAGRSLGALLQALQLRLPLLLLLDLHTQR